MKKQKLSLFFKQISSAKAKKSRFYGGATKFGHTPVLVLATQYYRKGPWGCYNHTVQIKESSR